MCILNGIFMETFEDLKILFFIMEKQECSFLFHLILYFFIGKFCQLCIFLKVYYFGFFLWYLFFKDYAYFTLDIVSVFNTHVCDMRQEMESTILIVICVIENNKL